MNLITHNIWFGVKVNNSSHYSKRFFTLKGNFSDIKFMEVSSKSTFWEINVRNKNRSEKWLFRIKTLTFPSMVVVISETSCTTACTWYINWLILQTEIHDNFFEAIRVSQGRYVTVVTTIIADLVKSVII